MADDLQTINPDQLSVASAVAADAFVLVQTPGGPLQRIPHSALLSKLIATDLVKPDEGTLLEDLDWDADKVALVDNDPNTLKNGWYRKSGASGTGTWTLFELLAKSAREQAEKWAQSEGEEPGGPGTKSAMEWTAAAQGFAGSADVARALAVLAAESAGNYKPTLAEAVAAYDPGEAFVCPEVTAENPDGADRRYLRTVDAPGYELTADQPVSGNALASNAAGKGAAYIRWEGIRLDNWLADQYVNVRQLGAVGDDETDDTNAFKAARDTGKNIFVPEGRFQITEPILLQAGQLVTGYDSGNFTETLFTRVSNMVAGGGCFWYDGDTSTGQKKAPQIRNLILQGDYPVRFNNEETATINGSEVVTATTVPHLMKPFVQNCDIRPRVAGTGIGVSWSKCFDGEIEDCEIQQFAINVLLNGCDLNRVNHNRIRHCYQYQILELSSSTFDSQNDIRHNDILNASAAGAIFFKTTARHALFRDNYLEQSSGTIVGFIDASAVDVPIFGGNTGEPRLTTVIENNRIDQHQRATDFVYRYDPSGQHYGSIIDVGHSGVNAIAPTLLICDEDGDQTDELPFCFNQSNPAQYRFFGAKFGVWDGYQTKTLAARKWDGENLLSFGQVAIYNNRLDQHLFAKGKHLVLKSGFLKGDGITPQDGILPLPASVHLVPGHRYAFKMRARCTSGSETALLGIVLNNLATPGLWDGVRDIRPVLGTEFQTYTLRFTASTDVGRIHAITLQHRTNGGADIEIAEIELVKVYDVEVPRTVGDSLVFTVPATEGRLIIRADGSGSAYPATRIYQYAINKLIEVGSDITNGASIDFTVTPDGTDPRILTIAVTGSGSGKAVQVGYNGP